MSKLQNGFTTPEQSKRLLELGVPANSADCCLNGDSVIILNGKTFQENYNEDLEFARLHLIEYPHYIPCWSVGELMKIFTLCFDPDFIHFDTYADGITFLQQMMDKFETYAENMDFSKLKE